MLQIGLLSDTHGYLDDRIFHHFDTCDEIWHAGDVGSMDILEQLESFRKVRAVYGNIDGHRIRAALPEIQRFTLEEVDVLIKHIGGYPGRYDPSVAGQIRENPPRLFISGHSHILKVIPDKKYELLHINPGSAGKSGLHTIRTLVRFRLDKGQISELEVIELGRMG